MTNKLDELAREVELHLAKLSREETRFPSKQVSLLQSFLVEYNLNKREYTKDVLDWLGQSDYTMGEDGNFYHKEDEDGDKPLDSEEIINLYENDNK